MKYVTHDGLKTMMPSKRGKGRVNILGSWRPLTPLFENTAVPDRPMASAYSTIPALAYLANPNDPLQLPLSLWGYRWFSR